MQEEFSFLDNMSTDVELNIDNLIARLLDGKTIKKKTSKYSIFLEPENRSRKPVEMSESEIRELCLKSRKIFLSQPVLLELKSPVKVCGMNNKIHSFYLHIY
jgi:serine/threonine-protein phosphatase PP1 catalytic subunit